MGNGTRWLAQLVLVAVLVACGEPRAPADASPPVSSPRSAPEVEIAGCQSTRREPLTCSLRTERTHLNLWIAGREAPLVEVDGVPANARTRPSLGDTGWTVELEVSRDAHELSVRVGRDGPPWTIAVEKTEPTPLVDAIESELAARPGDTEAYRRGLARLDASVEQMSTYERIVAGRTSMLILRELGQNDRAIARGDNALELALERDYPAEAIDISQVLVFLRAYPLDAAGVRLQLDLQGWYLAGVADSAQRTRWHYYRGVHAFEAGEFRLALEELQRAERDAKKLGLVGDELAAAGLRAPLLGLVGRRLELATLVERILVLTLDTGVNRCQSANDLNSAGWAVLLARANAGVDDTAGKLFERSISYYSPGGGCDVRQHSDYIENLQLARINYALEASMRSDFSSASARAGLVDEDALRPGNRVWLRYIEAELAMRRGDAEAALAAVHGIDHGDDLLLAWQSAVIEGRALEGLAREQEALRAYQRAERSLEEATHSVGFDQGREGLLAGRSSSSGHVVRLQVAQGDVATAAATARRARARAVRFLGRGRMLSDLPDDARQRRQSSLARYDELSRELARELTELWRLPQTERDRILRRHAEVRREMREHLGTAYDAMASRALARPLATRPAPGELWLLYYPVGEEWYAFAITEHSETVEKVPKVAKDESLERTASRLLDPFRSSIQDARSIHLLTMGELDDVAFHVLPWNGEPLMLNKPVAYRLDLGVPGHPSRRESGAVALVIADPASRRIGVGRLPRAREEGELVAKALRTGGFDVTLLAAEQAVHTDVVVALARADWLHYAGHGFSMNGWDSALPLAGEAELDARDIVVLPRVPGAVVLSGCRTGTIDDAAGGGQHLAAAFLLAGSRFVIATSADVADDAAVEVARSLYESLGDGRGLDGPELLRQAMLRAERSGGNGMRENWQHYRAWVP